MFSLQYSLLSVILIVICTPNNSKQQELLKISTPSGQLEGLKYETENSRTAYAFLGIPYAQPPLGNLRFRAPVPLPPWTGVYNATQPGNICIQPQSGTLGATQAMGNEDCLFINVYTPSLPTNETNPSLPCLVWIHGGGFMYGSGNLGQHGADRFLGKGLVVVSLNYRIGVFGFLSTEDSAAPGNYGLKDQVLALNWTHENIAAFGGDPQRVTIFGESAGAASVHFLRQAKRARKYFNQAIANSGNSINPWSMQRGARSLTVQIAASNGILTLSSQTMVNRLRTVDAMQLQRSTVIPTTIDIFDFRNGLPFGPVLEAESDEAVCTSLSYVAQMNGDFNPGPLLHGYNSLESGNLSGLPLPVRASFLQYNLFPSRLTPLDMNATVDGRRIVGRNIKSFYFNEQSVLTQPALSYFLSDDIFVRSIVKSTELESLFCPVYLYNFSFNKFEGAYSGGVAHAEDMPFLWSISGFSLASPAVRLTVERMVQLWSNFAKTGNPTPILTPEVNVTWPANAGGGDTIYYLDIGEVLVPKTNPREEQMEFWDDQYEEHGRPPYNQY